jgi:hypothetical protein
LRNPLDTEIAKVPGTGMAQLFSDVKSAPVNAQHSAVSRPQKAATKPAVYTIEVLNGSQRTEQKFAGAEEKQ